MLDVWRWQCYVLRTSLLNLILYMSTRTVYLWCAARWLPFTFHSAGFTCSILSLEVNGNLSPSLCRGSPHMLEYQNSPPPKHTHPLTNNAHCQFPINSSLFPLPVGEPINREAWDWYHRVVGDGRCPVVDTWWQTGNWDPHPTVFITLDLFILCSLSRHFHPKQCNIQNSACSNYSRRSRIRYV